MQNQNTSKVAELKPAIIILIEKTREELYDKYFPLPPSILEDESDEEYFNSDKYFEYEQATDIYYDADSYLSNLIEELGGYDYIDPSTSIDNSK